MADPSAFRTTADLVRGIIAADPSADLTPFIATANQLVTDVCGGSGYPDGFVNSKMELIERWLAAHFYAVNDNQLASAKAGTVAASFQYKVGLSLLATMYGQQALILDTAGNLAALENTNQTKRKIKVSIGWLGRRWPWWRRG